MMDLYKFLNKNIRYKDHDGNIIEAYAQDYDDGLEEDDDDFLYNNPYLFLTNIKVIVNKNYDGDEIISQKEIVSIEEIK